MEIPKRIKYKGQIYEAVNLKESSLSRTYGYFVKFDVACVAADKYLPDRSDFDSQEEYDNAFRDRLRKQRKIDAKVLRMNLEEIGSTTPIKGFYQYNSKTAPQKDRKSFLCANTDALSDFKERIMEQACKAKQNSFYYSETGTFSGYWIYTGIDLSEEDEIDKNHNKWDKVAVGKVHFGSYATDDEGTGYSLVNGRPFASYDIKNNDSQIISYQPQTVKTQNIHNNVLVIDDEPLHEDKIADHHTKTAAMYRSKVNKILKECND